MKSSRHIFRYKLYKNIIISYITLVIITVTLLSSILFYFFSSSSSKEIDKNLKSMLTQMSYASNVIYNQVLTISNQLNMDNEIITYVNTSEKDNDYNKVIRYNIYNKLSKIQAMYPFISSIGIYNDKNQINVDTKNIPIDKKVISENSKKYLFFYTRKISVEGISSGNFMNLLTFVLYSDFLSSAPTKSAIVINIDQQYILNTIISINKKSQDSTTFVMDSTGHIISDTDYSYFMKDISGENYYKNIINEKTGEGSFTQTINDKKQLVTFVKSNDLNWYFVSIKPYDKLISNIYELRNVTLIITLVLVIIGIFISMFITGIIYNPMKLLMDNIEKNNGFDKYSNKLDEYKILSEAFIKSQNIERSANSYILNSYRVIKENYLLNLIKGNMNELSSSDEVINKIENEIAAPYFCCILFKIDNFNRFKEKNDLNNQSLFRFAICNIAKDLLAKQCRNEYVIAGEDEVVVLLKLTEDVINDKHLLILEEIQDVLKRYFKFTVTVAIGDIVYSKNDIYLSYKSSLEYSKYRLFYGYDRILDSKIIEKNFTSVVKYPSSIEKKLIEAIQLGNKAILRKYIDEFTNTVCKSSYYQTVNYYSQLTISIFRHFEDSIDLFDEHIDNVNKINNSEIIEDICQIVQDFSIKICVMLDEKNNKTNSMKYKLMVDKVKMHIKENYTNPGLSLEMISEIINLSPGYFGKIFKSNMNMSFNEYLNNIRLEKAKELLLDTNEPSSKICEEVGIYNVTYFSTLFKKTYGLTPSQFREQAAKV